ncbi:unnamed protein product, partial [marine sediment metagenome]
MGMEVNNHLVTDLVNDPASMPLLLRDIEVVAVIPGDRHVVLLGDVGQHRAQRQVKESLRDKPVAED